MGTRYDLKIVGVDGRLLSIGGLNNQQLNNFMELLSLLRQSELIRDFEYIGKEDDFNEETW